MHQGRETLRKHGRAEFLSRSSPQENMWNTTSSPSTWPQSPVKGIISWLTRFLMYFMHMIGCTRHQFLE